MQPDAIRQRLDEIARRNFPVEREVRPIDPGHRCEGCQEADATVHESWRMADGTNGEPYLCPGCADEGDLAREHRALRAVLDEIDNSVERDRTLPDRVRRAIAEKLDVE